MTGLTFGDSLTLSPFQHTTLLVNMLAALWMSGQRRSFRVHLLAVCLLCAALFTAFVNHPIGVDVRITCDVAQRLTPYTGRAFLSELAFVNYLKLQPPLWGWMISRVPVFWVHQLYALAFGGGLWGGIVARNGLRTAWIAFSAPLVQLMITQPSNDLSAVVFLLYGILLYERGHRWPGLALTVVSACLKYTVYAALPFLWPVFRWDLGVIVGGIANYWAWALSTRLLWSTQQAEHYLSQFTFSAVSPRTTVQVSGVSRPWWWLLRKLGRVLSWRWRRLGLPSVTAMWWYALPWGSVLSWRLVGFTACVLLGYGNVKYLLMCVVFLPLCARNAEF